MAGKNTVSISFVIGEGKDGLKQLTLDADGLRKVMSETVKVTSNLEKNVINFAAICTGIDSVSNSLNSLLSCFGELAEANAVQVQAETQLAVNMRNTMDAREEDIQSIKDLCSAQQALGVIGDEVQLAGAQELATYLTQKESLEKLIPVMNDMLAQQYGLNASQENASQIATMLGKVMDGQTGALSRYGYSFDEAQEKILKYGTEAERAAVLSDVVSSSIGGMNAALAQTESGKLKQMDNKLGDIKEKIGAIAEGAMPFLTIAANTTIALGGLLKFGGGIKTVSHSIVQLTSGVSAFVRSTGHLTSSSSGLVKAFGTARLFISQLGSAVMQGTKGLKLFAMAWRGMLISTGIGIAIAAVTAIIYHFATNTDKATASTNKFLDAQERAKRDAEQLEQLRQQENSTLVNSRALLDINIAKLAEFNGTKEQEKKLVGEMNDTYGETMGYFSSVSDWYNALIANSEAYCRQMVIEARTRQLANMIAEKQQENHDIIYDDKGNKRTYSTTRQVEQYQTGTYFPTTGGMGGAPQPIYSQREIVGTSELDKANKSVSENNEIIKNYYKQLTDATKEAANIQFSVTGLRTRPNTSGGGTSSQTSNDPVWTEDPKKLKEFTDNIRILQKELEDTSDIDTAAKINKDIESYQKQADAIRNAGKETKESLSFNENAKTLGELTENLRYLEQELNKVGVEGAASLNQQKKATEEQIEAIRNAGLDTSSNKTVDADAKTIREITANISALNEQLQDASAEEAASINQQIDLWNKKADAIRNAGKEAQVTFETFRSGWDGIKGVGSGIESITSALEGNGNAWQKITGIVDGFLQIYDGIAAIVSIINRLTGATNTLTASKTADAAATVTQTGAIATNTAAEVANQGVKAAGAVTDAADTVTTGINTAATEVETSAINTNTQASLQNVAIKSMGSVVEGVDAGVKGVSTAATEVETAALEVNTQASMQNTLAKSGEALANATASGAKLPFPANLAAIAAGVAAVVSVIAMIGGFANGGIVGGASPSGDRLLARVNSGEMILNMKQQRNLFQLLNSPVRGVDVPRPQALDIRLDTGYVHDMRETHRPSAPTELVLRGRTLVGLMANETRIASKSGKRTNIKI